MVSSFSKAGRRVLATTAATFALLAMAVGLSGCPVAAELENEDRFPALTRVARPQRAVRRRPAVRAVRRELRGAAADGRLRLAHGAWCGQSMTRILRQEWLPQRKPSSGKLNLATALEAQGNARFSVCFAPPERSGRPVYCLCPAYAVCDPAAATCESASCPTPARFGQYAEPWARLDLRQDQRVHSRHDDGDDVDRLRRRDAHLQHDRHRLVYSGAQGLPDRVLHRARDDTRHVAVRANGGRLGWWWAGGAGAGGAGGVALERVAPVAGAGLMSGAGGT